MYLANGQVQQSLLSLIVNLPIDAENPLQITIGEKTKARGIDQNGLYWKRLTEIADQAYFNGRQFDKEVWHEYARQNVMPDEIVTKDGEARSKYVETPSGATTIISTTKLERKCFSEYITALEAFGAGLGVMFSANPNERAA